MSDEHTQVEEVERPAAVVTDDAPAPKYSASEDARAVAGIKRAKGLGGLFGFGITALGAYLHGELVTQVLTRALIGGIAGYMTAWLAAVVVWRRIIRAEITDRLEQRRRARAAALPDAEVS